MDRVVYYVKQGRRYKPVSIWEAHSGLTPGFYLLEIRAGSTSIQSIKEPINPDYARVLAALKTWEDAVQDAMMHESRLRTASTRISPKERKAWDVFEATMGEDMPTLFTYPSIAAIARKGRKTLEEKING